MVPRTFSLFSKQLYNGSSPATSTTNSTDKSYLDTMRDFNQNVSELLALLNDPSLLWDRLRNFIAATFQSGLDYVVIQSAGFFLILAVVGMFIRLMGLRFGMKLVHWSIVFYVVVQIMGVVF